MLMIVHAGLHSKWMFMSTILPKGTGSFPTCYATWPWGPEATFAASSLVSPGYADIIISCQLISPNQPLTESPIKSAVRLLRSDHPTIAARFACPASEDGSPPSAADVKLAYEVPASEREVDLWLNEVVTVRTDTGGDVDAAVALVAHDLGKAAAGPPTTLFEAHFIPGSTSRSALVLRLGHAVFDGIGVFQALDLLNERIARVLRSPVHVSEPLNWGEETARLALPTPECTKIPWSLAAEMSEDDQVMLDRLVEAINMEKVSKLPSHRIQRLTQYPPLPDPPRRAVLPPPPGSTHVGTGVIMRTMPAESVQALRSAARARSSASSSPRCSSPSYARTPAPAPPRQASTRPSTRASRTSAQARPGASRTAPRATSTSRGTCRRRWSASALRWNGVDEFTRVWGAAQGAPSGNTPPLPVPSSMGVVDQRLSARQGEYLTITEPQPQPQPQPSMRTPTLARAANVASRSIPSLGRADLETRTRPSGSSVI
ncbi:hypothetical protein GLOTRDRAFT_133810 [Gloeophyllum trabeum ATCC 11539]|uniref:Uncharacterized protein n=1 Tax=Gloeophyllum trabeum (strain ATCC 11539 / FP-39264 / Madison 617) TaxID=670483 RepID=S7PTF4_GLOTA|nr:uncharacterized protein GLOTRDRAFT_133810 [Gloeophyllum trabeum ATCC 11539]EPQ50708.1 hypothetical protein GLOTRDRAFT_133810 [Gloeophyllum trabeum ATCC 11539]